VRSLKENVVAANPIDPIGDEAENQANESHSNNLTRHLGMPSKPSFSKPSLVQFWLTRSTLFLVSAIAAATAGSLLAVTLPLPGAVSPNLGQKLLGNLVKSAFQYQVSRPVNVLVMGIDRVPGTAPGDEAVFSGRSDTMLLIQANPQAQTINMLSIPRDTQVDIPGVGVTKINQANASGGPILARETLSKTLNDVPIDRYVRVSTEAFRELVNLIGGVRIYVPKPMQYEDKTQKLKIDLQAGWQHLNGEQAEEFARFRNDNFGDIGRVQRQQSLLKALKEQMSNPLTIAQMPGILRSMQKYVDTNLAFEEMLALVNMGLKLDQKDFKMVMLPGRFSGRDEFKASYWVMDPDGRDRIMQEYFTATKTADPTADPTNVTADQDQANPNTPEQNLRIAIQNAATDPNAASKVAEYLMRLGYGNVFVTTEAWDDVQAQTQVIVQGGQLKSAKIVQDTLKVGVVNAASTGDLDSDLTIRVGNDWSNIPFTSP
jgi:polyisoprenyl-teichoic acid--peptidoglycan teichoic acid transferase